MENVFIVSDYSNWLTKLIGQLGIIENQVLSYEEMYEDWEFDNWVKNISESSKAIIIPIELGKNNETSIEGLRIGMHLRLLPIEFKIRLIPIVFISNRDHSEISLLCRNNRDKNHYDYLIGTKGTDITKPIIEEIQSIIQNLEPLVEEEYKEGFYDHIKINSSDKIGKHSLANIWGAFRLAEVTGHQKNLLNNVELLKRHKDLYFKYINAITGRITNHNNGPRLKTINTTNKSILFIDDEASKGWSLILEAIFNSDIETLDRHENESFDIFYQRARNKALELNNNLPKWDLILLDLRLDESEDLGDEYKNTAKEYSGGKLLLEIKKANRGTQVIIFTASNKAWNMGELLSPRMGADGYYIKESPEYNDWNFSTKNFNAFEETLKDCFNKGFLRRIYHKLSPLENLCKIEGAKSIKNYSLSINQSTIQKTIDQLFICEKLISDFPLDLKWSFISLVLIIEEFVNEYYSGDEYQQCISISLMNQVKCNYIDGGKRKLALTPIIQNSYIKYTKGEYIVSSEEMHLYNQRDTRIPFNFRLSCILHFKYNLPLDNSIFKYFKVYQLRSQSAAHAGNGTIGELDMILAIELLSILIK